MDTRGGDWKRARAERRDWQALQQRVGALEAATKAPAPPGPAPLGPWARFVSFMGSALPQLITGIVVLVVGFSLKDSVDLAIRQQQLQLSFVTSMKSALDAMAQEPTTERAVAQAATMVAAFGRPAILPLIYELGKGNLRTAGAEVGLTALALNEPEEVCRLLQLALVRSPRLLQTEGYGGAVRTLAAVRCTDARPVLQAHLRRAEELLLAQERAVAESRRLPEVAWLGTPPTVTQVKEIIRALKQGLSTLEAPSP